MPGDARRPARSAPARVVVAPRRDLPRDLASNLLDVARRVPDERDAGTGTPCMHDAQCEGLEASACIRLEEAGFCSIEGCGAGECGASYVCCRDCNPMAAPMLPFEGSACLPEAVSDALATMAGCSCD